MDKKLEKVEFLEWKRNPITAKYLEILKSEIEDYKDLLANGSTVNTESMEMTAINTIQVVAKIQQLRDILAINEVDIEEYV